MFSQLSTNTPRSLSARQLSSQPLFPQPVALHEVVPQVQDPALSLVEPHAVGFGPSVQPIQISLQSPPTLEQINTASLLTVHSIPLSRSLIKILKRTYPITERWGTLLVTGLQLDLTPFTTNGVDPALSLSLPHTTSFVLCALTRHYRSAPQGTSEKPAWSNLQDPQIQVGSYQHKNDPEYALLQTLRWEAAD